MDNYCIRPDYVAREANLSLDEGERKFWGEERIRESALYQWHVYAFAANLVQERSIGAVLDVGCGTAAKLVEHLAPVTEIYGIDQPSAASFCRDRYKCPRFFADDFEAPQLDLKQDFRLIICSDVIEHVTNPDVLLNYIRRFCSPDSLVLLSTPDRDRLRGRNSLRSPKAEHVREWNYAEFGDYVRSRGFEIVRHWHLPPVKTAANRLFAVHLLRQLTRLRPYNLNQAVLCRLTQARPS